MGLGNGCVYGTLLTQKLNLKHKTLNVKITDMKSEIRKGTLAVCGMGYLGLITEDKPREITYPDCNKFVTWVGIHLTDKVFPIGSAWSSRKPIVVGHTDDYKE